MKVFKLALKNLLGGGVKTWLNVVVLSLAYVMIIWMQGIYEGINERAGQALIETICGGGQYWHPEYDPYDPLKLQDAHGPLPGNLALEIDQGRAVPILIVPGSIYPAGRFRSVAINGIDPDQTLLTLPTASLNRGESEGEEPDDIPVLIGSRMAKSGGLKKGDSFTIRWRDADGTFDARTGRIMEIMKTQVQNVDSGQLWVPLDRLRTLTRMEGEATITVLAQDAPSAGEAGGWMFRDQDYLLQDLRNFIQGKQMGGAVLYAVLLFMAMLAIFNTQVLSIFRRRREMGTLMALGFTRWRVIRLFTVEGGFHGILAALLGAVYGIPFLTWFAATGWAMPSSMDSFGLNIGSTIYPTYSVGLVIGTTLLVLLVTTFVSFLPTRKIARLKPTDALRGRFS